MRHGHLQNCTPNVILVLPATFACLQDYTQSSATSSGMPSFTRYMHIWDNFPIIFLRQCVILLKYVLEMIMCIVIMAIINTRLMIIVAIVEWSKLIDLLMAYTTQQTFKKLNARSSGSYHILMKLGSNAHLIDFP